LFYVTSGTTYYVWWNDANANQGKTLNVRVNAAYNSGTNIFTNIYWASPQSFTANISSMVKIKVTPLNSGNIGTFAVAYNTSSTRPTASGAVLAALAVTPGSSITLPAGSDLYRPDCTFGGWNTNADGTGANYTAGSSYTPTGSITLYAKWDAVPLESVMGFAGKLAWLRSNAQSNSNYTLELDTDEFISPYTLSYGIMSDITITLIGTGANRTVYLSDNGSMFTVGSGVTLVLDNNITLRGRIANNNSLVVVNAGGTLRMNNGSAVTGNTESSTSNHYGSGVFVDGGIFEMNRGTISDNTEISSSSCGGGGVWVRDGTFTMSGGTISGNTGSGSSNYVGGGGVYAGGGIFTKTGGTIYGYSSDDTVNSNTVRAGSSTGTVQSNRGHAVYAQYTSSRGKRMESTAGPGVSLWWNYNNDSPVFSGDWEY